MNQHSEHPALLIIDMVKDNFQDERRLPITPLARKIIEPINQTIHRFRSNNWPVIFSTDSFHLGRLFGVLFNGCTSTNLGIVSTQPALSAFSHHDGRPVAIGSQNGNQKTCLILNIKIFSVCYRMFNPKVAKPPQLKSRSDFNLT